MTSQATAPRTPATLSATFARLLTIVIAIGGANCQSALAQHADAAEGADTAPESSEAADEGGGNFLTLPIFITEPAIGEGLGVGLVYFHEK